MITINITYSGEDQNPKRFMKVERYLSVDEDGNKDSKYIRV